MRRQLLGFEAVRSDGTVLRRLPGMPKDNTGYDLAGLLAGSEGTLAVLTRIRLRLVPPLAQRAVAVTGFADAASAVAAAGRLRRELASVLALELFTDEASSSSCIMPGWRLRSRGVGRSTCSSRRAPTRRIRRTSLLTALEAIGVDDEASAMASDPGGRHRLWQLRERHTEAVNAEGVPHKLDVSVPVARYAELIERGPSAVAAVAPEARTIVYGHVGDGNVHVNVLGPAPEDDRVDDAVLELVLELGGSVSAEHGIGIAKVGWLVRDRGPEAVGAMRALKAALDPAGILNPGVLFER